MNWTKAIETYIFDNPLSLGDSWGITKMTSTEIKVERKVSVAFLVAREENGSIYLTGRNMTGRSYCRKISADEKSADKIIQLIKIKISGLV